MPHRIHTKTLTPPRARLLTATALLSVALALAGCGGNSPSPGVAHLSPGKDTSSASSESGGSSPGSPASLQQAMIAFAKCMRANGVPNFPDPKQRGLPRPRARIDQFALVQGGAGEVPQAPAGRSRLGAPTLPADAGEVSEDRALHAPARRLRLPRPSDHGPTQAVRLRHRRAQRYRRSDPRCSPARSTSSRRCSRGRRPRARSRCTTTDGNKGEPNAVQHPCQEAHPAASPAAHRRGTPERGARGGMRGKLDKPDGRCEHLGVRGERRRIGGRVRQVHPLARGAELRRPEGQWPNSPDGLAENHRVARVPVRLALVPAPAAEGPSGPRSLVPTGAGADARRCPHVCASTGSRGSPIRAPRLHRARPATAGSSAAAGTSLRSRTRSTRARRRSSKRRPRATSGRGGEPPIEMATPIAPRHSGGRRSPRCRHRCRRLRGRALARILEEANGHVESACGL